VSSHAGDDCGTCRLGTVDAAVLALTARNIHDKAASFGYDSSWRIRQASVRLQDCAMLKSLQFSDKKHLSLPLLTIVACIVMALLFTILMVLAYCVPVSWVKQNVAESAPYHSADIESTVNEDYWTYHSDYTVRTMLSMVSHGGDDPLKDSMRGYWYKSGNDASNWILDGLNEPPNQTYERYWNGWMVLLRPLFVILNYGQVKQLFWIAFLILLAIASASLAEKLKDGRLYACALCVALITIAPHAVGSLVYSYIILLALGSIIWVINRFSRPLSRILRKELLLGFFVIGGITQYLDFLTFPALTLIMPLVVYLLAAKEYETQATPTKELAKKLFILTLGISMFWCLGYGLLWASKWVIGSIVLGQDIISSSFNQVLFRTGATGSGFGVSEPISEWKGIEISALSSIKLQIEALLPWVKPWMIIIAALVLLAFLVPIRKDHRTLCVAVFLLAASLLPYVWFAVASNHSIIHFSFTYRLQAATIFAFGCYIVLCWNAIRARKTKLLKESQTRTEA